MVTFAARSLHCQRSQPGTNHLCTEINVQSLCPCPIISLSEDVTCMAYLDSSGLDLHSDTRGMMMVY